MSMLLPLELLQHAAVPAAEAVVSGLWQGMALSVVIAIVLRFLPGTSASTRFAVWIAVFAASVVMPLAHLFAAISGPAAAPSSHLVFDPRWSYLLAGLWFGASILRFLRLLAEAVSLRKLWCEATPLSPGLLDSAQFNLSPENRRPKWSLVRILPHAELENPERASVTETARTFLPRFTRTLQICTTPNVDRPSVIGFFAPKILIPDWLAAQLSPTELRHIVLHEIEHLRRHDDWLNLLQKIGLVLFPLNPAMFWIDRRLSTEREIACDDGVLARTKAPRAYALSLTTIAERRLGPHGPRRMVALALGALGGEALLLRRSEFAKRIENILGQRTVLQPAFATTLVITLVAGVLSGTAAMSHAPDFVTFGSSMTPSVAAVSSTPDRVVPVPSSFSSTGTFETASYHVGRSTVRKRSDVKSSHARSNAIRMPPHDLSGNPVSPRAKVLPPGGYQPKSQWMLLTSWEPPTTYRPGQQRAAGPVDAADPDEEAGTDLVVPVSRIVVRAPDGRFFATPYAAVPTQGGWLIVQL